LDWPDDFEYTSLQINTGKTLEHRDSSNIGLSCTFSCGNFTGGNLEYAGEQVVTFQQPFVFDGSRLHATMDFRGTRFSLVAFTHEKAHELNHADFVKLSGLSFPLPDPTWIKAGEFLKYGVPLPIDMGAPFVVNGGGAVKGMGILEQVEWAKCLIHPDSTPKTEMLDDLQKVAVQYELSTSTPEIDEMRCEWLARHTLIAHSLLSEAEDWKTAHGIQDLAMCKNLNGPFIKYLISSSMYTDEDKELATDIAGFPLVGTFPPSGPDTQPMKKPKRCMIGIEKLVEIAPQINVGIVDSLRSSEFDDDLMEIAMTDAAMGFNSPPRPLEKWHMEEVNLCRRIPVREERAGKWRTRPVDDESENMVNMAAVPCDATVYDDLLLLVLTVLLFLQEGLKVMLWKRDVMKAFRWMLIQRSHARFAWSVFSWKTAHGWFNTLDNPSAPLQQITHGTVWEA
jgi:hypothetical protein